VGEDIIIDMAPGIDVLAALKELRRAQPKQALATALTDFLPKRLAQKIADTQNGPARMADFSDKLLLDIAAAVKQWRVTPNGTEGYRTAEVTLGGVDTAELSSKTFEAKSVPGLYFIGEVIDVTGQLGGFNFQWAWSSGHAAGRHV
jgi:predicted Rossmann fold flavoprotein